MQIFTSCIIFSGHTSGNECIIDNCDDELFQYCLSQKPLNTCAGLPHIRPIPKLLLRLFIHYGDITQMLYILTRLSFFKNCIQFSIHTTCYYLPEFFVVLTIYAFLPLNRNLPCKCWKYFNMWTPLHSFISEVSPCYDFLDKPMELSASTEQHTTICRS